MAGASLPEDFRSLPAHFLIRASVRVTNEVRGLIPDFIEPKRWRKFRAFAAERRLALGNTALCMKLYEDDSFALNAFLKMSCMSEAREVAEELARANGYGDLLGQKVEECDPDRLRNFLELYLNGPVQEMCDAVDQWDLDDEQGPHVLALEGRMPEGLSDDEQKEYQLDAVIFMSLILLFIHNSIAIMAYGESMVSLFQRAIAGDSDSDEAMCKAVRVDSGLCEHSVFLARHLRAKHEGDESFLRRYDMTLCPIPSKVRYPGLYFLFATLDAYGMLHSLSNDQILDLCDHARLDRWESRIVDVGNLAKRKREYLANKFR